uniref:Uncharacterized protein n=1 Tax=viral metagenome TaxID=1070528 RepID=A0A6C0CKI6_9ZZZZ
MTVRHYLKLASRATTRALKITKDTSVSHLSQKLTREPGECRLRKLCDGTQAVCGTAGTVAAVMWSIKNNADPLSMVFVTCLTGSVCAGVANSFCRCAYPRKNPEKSS